MASPKPTLRRAWAALCVMAALLCTAAAWAQGRDPAAAEILFAEGRKAMRAGDYEQACERFSESQRLDPGAGTLINLAECLAKRGLLASSWEKWRQALGTLGQSDDRRWAVEKRIAELEERLPRLIIRLDPEAPGSTEVKRGDVVLRSIAFGLPLPVDPGEHTLIVSAPGFEEARVDVALKEGEQREVVVAPGPPNPTEPEPSEPVASPPAAAAPVETDEPRGSAPIAGYVVGGLGVVGLTVGGIAGILAIGEKGVMDDECASVDGELRCSAQGLDASSSGQTLSTVANIGVAVGAVGLAVGAYLVLSHDDASETTTALSLMPRRSGAAAILEHRFP